MEEDKMGGKTNKTIFSNRYDDTSSGLLGSGFWRLMLVWRGSVFKLVWLHLFAFLFVFSSLNLLYKNVFMYNDIQRETFELICVYCSRFSSKIPVTFMTGFYVANVCSRYWDQFISLPWPDRLALKLVSFVPGQDDYSRSLRRTVMRYINLSTVLVFRLVSPKVMARFPSYGSLVDAGLMLPGEDVLLTDIDAKTSHETTWAPIMWAANLLQKERAEGRFKIEGTVYVNLVSTFEYVEGCNRKIFNHGWVNFPFAYTQVITLTVYTYLFSNLFGHQFLEPRDNNQSTLFEHIGVKFSKDRPFDLHTPIVEIPVFTIIEFIAYLGWIKVAETLLNPWGDDDEDFQINYLIDRNFQTSFLIVDDALTDMEVRPDSFMGKCVPSELPYCKKQKSKSKLGRKLAWMENSELAKPINQLRDHIAAHKSTSAGVALKRMNNRKNTNDFSELTQERLGASKERRSKDPKDSILNIQSSPNVKEISMKPFCGSTSSDISSTATEVEIVGNHSESDSSEKL